MVHTLVHVRLPEGVNSFWIQTFSKGSKTKKLPSCFDLDYVLVFIHKFIRLVNKKSVQLVNTTKVHTEKEKPEYNAKRKRGLLR